MEHIPKPKLRTVHAARCKGPLTALKRIEMSMNDFCMICSIGKGSWGHVSIVKVTSGKIGGNLYAMKSIKKRRLHKRRHLEKITAEKEILEKVKHPFIVRLLCAFQDASNLHLVMEFCSGGDLFFHWKKLRKFSESSAKFYSAQLTSALAHLHENKILYRDIKLENLALSNRGNLRLIDFGLSKVGVSSALVGAKTLCGTLHYLSPEMLLKGEYGFCTDWWALGILLFTMTAGRPPWHSSSRDENEIARSILQDSLHFPRGTSSSFRRFLAGLLRRNPIQRLGVNGAKEIFEDSFFEGVDWTSITEEREVPPFCPSMNPEDPAWNFDSTFSELSKVSETSGRSKNGLDMFVQGYSFTGPLFRENKIITEIATKVQPEKRMNIGPHILKLLVKKIQELWTSTFEKKLVTLDLLHGS